MRYLLNAIYLTLVVLLSPWLIYVAVRKGKYRQGLPEKLLGLVPVRPGDRPCIWLHAVSVGEVNLLRPLLQELAERRPDCECVISTTTRAGYELAKSRYQNQCVFYCPLDFSWAVERALRRIRPTVLVLAELELWPNLIAGARRHGAAIAIINGRLGDKSFRGYRRLRPMARRMLAAVDLVAAQNEQYAARFRALGARSETVQVTGSIKFDGAQTRRDNPNTQRLRALAGFVEDDIVFLAGSTQEPEEELALTAFQRLAAQHPRLRLVLVPRHSERFAQVTALLASSGIPFVRRSMLEPGAAPDPQARVLLVDVIGELGAWWGTATIGFVGGSLTQRGGQNMIEPAAYGVATSFGPNTWNFRDIVSLLLAAEAAQVVEGGEALVAFVQQCLEQPAYATALGGRAQQLVATQLGAAARTAQQVASLLPAKDLRTRSAA